MRSKYAGMILLLALASVASLQADVVLTVLPREILPLLPGATTEMRVSVNNSGSQATDVELTVAFPPPFTVNSASGNTWNCAAVGNKIDCLSHVDGGYPYPSTPDLVLNVTVPSSLDGGRFAIPVDVAPIPANAGATAHGAIKLDVYRTFAVSRSDDFGAGSFRDAIAQANARCDNSVLCHMTFAQPMKIQPATPLPPITACALFIEAGTPPPSGAPSANAIAVPRFVELDGSHSTFANGLEIRSSCGVTLSGFAIGGFGANGVVLAAPLHGFMTIENCSIGTNAEATEARPNGLRGISVESPETEATVVSSVISGNARSGIVAWNAASLDVSGCLIGLGKDLRALPNGASGVFVDGGFAQINGGLIAQNHEFGIAVGSGAQRVVVHSAVTGNGGLPIDYGLDGPTPIDPSGHMPPVPQIIDATYDAAHDQTIVHLSVPTTGRRAGDIYHIEFRSAVPDAHLDTQIFPYAFAPPTSDVFAATIIGDHRGETIFAVTQHLPFPDSAEDSTSEYSPPFVVPR